MWPSPPVHNGNSVPGYTYGLIDANGEAIAFIFAAPKTGNLAKVRFRTGTVTTGDTIRISFQDVDVATGLPDGGVDQYRALAIADGDDNKALYTGLITSDGTDTGSLRAVTAGQIVAVVFDYAAYTAGNIQIMFLLTASGLQAFPYGGTRSAAGVWTKQALPFPLAVEYDDTTYSEIYGVCPAVTNIAAESYGSGSTPDEFGNLITVPMSCTANGIWIMGGWQTGACQYILYDTDGTTALATITMDPDIIGGSSYQTPLRLQFSSAVTLTKDGAYRIVAKPTTASLATLYAWSYPAATVLTAEPGGTQCYSTTRTDAGAWTDSQTKRYGIGLLLSQIDDGASSGGGVPIVGGGIVRGGN